MNLHFNNLVDNIYFLLFEVKVNNKLTMVLLKKKEKKELTMVSLPLEISYIL